MNIRKELEALRSDIADIPIARYEDVYDEAQECIERLDALLARIPAGHVLREIIEHEDEAGVRGWALASHCTECLESGETGHD